jgi:hypothetical protein
VLIFLSDQVREDQRGIAVTDLLGLLLNSLEISSLYQVKKGLGKG